MQRETSAGQADSGEQNAALGSPTEKGRGWMTQQISDQDLADVAGLLVASAYPDRVALRRDRSNRWGSELEELLIITFYANLVRGPGVYLDQLS